MKKSRRPDFKVGGTSVAPGCRETIDIPVSVLSDHTPVSLSVHVVHGKRPGPVLFVSAALHGDEIIGVEVVRRLLRARQMDKLRGTLLAVPVVNAFGFLNRSRYMPDRRDLNRSFPGRPKGSLAARLAHLFMREIVEQADFGIDIHSAAVHRSNLPQIRVSASQGRAMELAMAFGAPLVLTSKLRDGSLRVAAQEEGVGVIVYEAGEGLRFDEISVRAGVAGVLRVMHALDMVPGRGVPRLRGSSIRSSASQWLRAPAGGLFRSFRDNGERVAEGDVIGAISDPFGETEVEVRAELAGLLIGRANLPVVNEGDGIFHIAKISPQRDAESTIDSMTATLEDHPMFDEDEII